MADFWLGSMRTMGIFSAPLSALRWNISGLSKPFLRQVSRLLLGWMAAAGMLLSLSFFLKTSDDYSRLWFISLLLIGAALSLSMRLFAYIFLRQLRAGGRNCWR